jgi:hypothetical protein
MADAYVAASIAVDDNAYYVYDGNADEFFLRNGALTEMGNWTAWRRAGFDGRSTIDRDPKFRDAAGLDFCLDADSPAVALGFEPLPEAVCRDAG